MTYVIDQQSDLTFGRHFKCKCRQIIIQVGGYNSPGTTELLEVTINNNIVENNTVDSGYNL